MNKYWDKYKVQIIAVVIFIIVIVSVYFIAKAVGESQGKKSGINQSLPDIPGDNGELTDEDKRTIRDLKDRITSDSTSLWHYVGVHDTGAYKQLSISSDAILVGVNNLYASEEGKMLLTTIQTMGAINPATIDYSDNIVSRLKSLIGG